MPAIIELLAAMAVRTGAASQSRLLAAFADNEAGVLDTAAVAGVELSLVKTVYAASDLAERHDKTVRLAVLAQGRRRVATVAGWF